ncbi:ABC transporter substrate-binding protein [Sellimonas sp.]|uniref:ABC transporter substrate-binding protein n=1 Tax=Sellimonas sp. TaxID=2021466 RepID=UPI00257A6D22|nr:ABC transporter substrate-binding protein [Sellimonas sp.]
MKKKLLSALLVAALAASVLAGCAKEETGSSESDKKEETRLTKVTLNEVAHSIFYAPMYVAVEEDYFKDEGIDLELVTGFGENILGRDFLGKVRNNVPYQERF